MRKIVVGVQVSLYGVMQAPGGPWENPTTGFKFGGWVMPYFDQEFGEELDRVFKEKFDLLLGRKTYEISPPLSLLRRRRFPWRHRRLMGGKIREAGGRIGGTRCALDVLIANVKQYGFEGLVAMNPQSWYESGKRSGAWKKLRRTLCALLRRPATASRLRVAPISSR